MANEEVLRLKTTFVSEESLAQIRAMGREIGINLPAHGKKGAKELETGFKKITESVKGFGEQILKVVPGLEEFGLGAAGAGIAIATLTTTLTRISGKIVELKYASKELGMTERDLKGWSLAAEKAGIAPEAMIANLKSFRDVSQGFKYNLGGVRDELVRMGAGPVLARIMNARTETDKLKQAFDFKDALMKADPSGFKAREFFKIIGLGADSARLSFDEFERSREKFKPLTPEEIARAEKFHIAMKNLGAAWDELLEKTAIEMFPTLTAGVKKLDWLLEKIEAIDHAWAEFVGKGTLLGKILPGYDAPTPNRRPRAGATPPPSSATPDVPAGDAFKNFMHPKNVNPRSGYHPTAFTDGFGGGGNLSEFSKAVKDGVFAALVDFKTYVETGAAAGGAGGMMQASFGGSAGAAAGGGVGGRSGGWGGGGYTNLTPGTGGAAGAQKQVYDPGTGKVIPGDGGGHATPMQRRGDSAGMTVPAGSPITRTGLATVTTASGKKMQVDSRYAANFQGFINDYEKAGGVLGPNTATEGMRPGNPSGHPAGWAMDVNQTGWGRRGGGKTLPPDVEDALADKWGLVSGHKWGGAKGPDTGHFGVRSPEAARQALLRNGGEPTQATASDAAARSAKGSWFGNAPGWSDPSEPKNSPKSNRPGIALRDKSTMGQMFEVTTPDGRKFMLPQTDWGPAARTGRGIDITAAAGAQMGYTSKNFPTDKPFSYRRIDSAVNTAAAGAPKVEGNVNLTVNSNGTAAKTSASADGLWQKTTVQNYRQMQKTDQPNWGPG